MHNVILHETAKCISLPVFQANACLSADWPGFYTWWVAPAIASMYMYNSDTAVAIRHYHFSLPPSLSTLTHSLTHSLTLSLSLWGLLINNPHILALEVVNTSMCVGAFNLGELCSSSLASSSFEWSLPLSSSLGESLHHHHSFNPLPSGSLHRLHSDHHPSPVHHGHSFDPLPIGSLHHWVYECILKLQFEFRLC